MHRDVHCRHQGHKLCCGIMLAALVVPSGCDLRQVTDDTVASRERAATASLANTATASAPSRVSVPAGTFAQTTYSDVVLMKFGAPWCGPCRQIDRELTRLENSVDESRLRIVRVNVDQDPALARRYNVSSIPHLVLLQHGRKLDEHCGYLSEADLNKWIERSAVETNAFSPSTSLGEVHVNPFAQ